MMKRGMSGSGFLKMGLAGLLALALFDIAGCSPPRQEEGNHPNVVLIVIDALRADHLSCYGYERNTSPNIDRLAEEGVLFEYATSQASWTTPSVASILTGSYIAAQLVRSLVDGLRPLPEDYRRHDLMFLPQFLKGKGYQTSSFVSNPVACAFWGDEIGLEYVDRSNGMEDSDTFLPFGSLGRPCYSHTLTENAIAWLTEHHRERFFLWLHYNDVHGCTLPEGNDVFHGPGLDAGSMQGQIAQYDEQILFTDTYVGEFLAKLDSLGIRDSTLVVLASDHGEAFGEHGQYGHMKSLYEEELRVPLILSGGMLPKGVRIQEHVENVDIFPTIADVLGASFHSSGTLLSRLWGRRWTVDGASLLPLLKGDADSRKKTLFLSFIPALGSSSTYVAQVAAYDREGHKFIVNYNDRPSSIELYNLRTDPYEKENLFGNPQFASTIRSFENVVRSRTLGIGMHEKGTRRVEKEPTKEELEKLRALGYVQ